LQQADSDAVEGKDSAEGRLAIPKIVLYIERRTEKEKSEKDVS